MTDQTVNAGEVITAGQIVIGDTVQHHKRQWPPATVTRILRARGDWKRYELVYPSGRTATLSAVQDSERFIRY